MRDTDLPRDELIRIITELADRDITQLAPLGEGESTRAFRARSAAGDDLVVRVQKRSLNSFSDEAWAMNRCREAGVPVPAVLGVRTLHDDRGAVMVMERARGRPLAEVLHKLGAAEQARVWTNVGRVLGRLHGIPVSGFGFLHEADGGATRLEAADWRTYARELLEGREYDAPALAQAGLSVAEVGRLLEVVAVMGDLPYRQPVLCHGDLGADHLYIDTDLNVVDLIDFGLAQGSAAPLDFGVLHMYHPEIDLAWLVTGDSASAWSDRDIEQEALLHKVNVGMSFLAEAMRRGNESFKDLAVAGLRSWLADYESFSR